MSDSDQVIIKRVKKVSGDGHHGGAWKVAYADFVTAMMAFFLLMWLLNATTEDQRKGIADYFNPTIPISPISGGGNNVLNGATVFSDKTLAKDGTGGAKPGEAESVPEKELKIKTDDMDLPHADLTGDAATPSYAPETGDLDTLQERLLGDVENGDTEGLARHIQMRVSAEGLIIELVDVDDNPLFNVGSTNASPTMELLLKVITQSLSIVNNDISIVGHTDGLAFSTSRNYGNWELSTDRAHAARRLMIEAGFPADQVSEVAGKADTEPLVADKFAPQNRRISITILKS